MSPPNRDRSAWLWLGILLCTLAGAFFGAAIGIPNGLGIAGILIGTVTGLVLGIAGARASVRR